MAFGVTSTGFVVKTFADIRASIHAYLRDPSRLGVGLNLGASSPLGQAVDAVSLELASVWELAADLYASPDPNQAEGATLDRLVAGLFNYPRSAASPTTATVTLTGTAATVVPAGSQVSQATTGDLYATTADATIGGGGTVDVTVSEVNYLTRTEVPEAPAGSLTVIETPVSGWTAVSNAADAIPGTLDATDPEYRVAFEAGRAVSSSTTAAALRARILQVADVVEVIVRENLTLTTDALGQPGKSFWTIVDVDDNTDLTQREAIGALILAHKPGGIQDYGSVSVTVTTADESIEDPTAHLDYVTDSLMTIRVLSVELDGDEAPDWQTTLTAALVAEGRLLGIGDDLIYGRFCKVVYSTPGIINATIYVGVGASTTNAANITINPPTRARFDSARVEITEAP